MLLFTLKIILAHLIGDFVLQPKKWVKNRMEYGLKSKYLYAHIGVHFLLLSLFFITQIQAVIGYIALITVSHLLIDLAKEYVGKSKRCNPFGLFLADQILHLIVLGGIVIIRFSLWTLAQEVKWERLLVYLIALLLITSVSSIGIKIFFQKWSEYFPINTLKKDSLKDAGNIIGIIERLLIVLFININFLEGIGYLLAAKSIFRFGDLTNAKDRKLTEYILSGTLISFAIAIIVGITLKIMLNHLN